MSSTIENIICPRCGKDGQQETDHKTGGVYAHCNTCDYKEIITEEDEEDDEEEQKKKYKMVSTIDGNDEIELESNTEEEAFAEALGALEWRIVAYYE